MAATAVTLCGIELENPIIPASGTFGYGQEFAQLYDINMLGTFSFKGTTRAPRFGNPTPRIAEYAGGMLNAVGLQNPGVDAVIAHELPELKKVFHKPVMANVSGFSVEEYAEVCARLDAQPQVGWLEVNISCPNVHGGGAAFGAEPSAAAEVTRAVRAVTKKPIILKLSPTAADIAAEAAQPLPFAIEKDSAAPQVLIMHTHATEDYRLSAGLWFIPGDGARSTDRSINMCAVGRVMADTLNAAGICTLHDETLNDYPSYTGSYANSRAVVQQYLAQYPSIKVVLDVHRDAIERENGTRCAPVCSIDGRQAAQVMIICGCDNGTSVQLPAWRQNLRFAAAWERSMEAKYPGLTRPVLFSYRFYNQDLTTGSLLIEIGGHGNNLNEALYAGYLAAQGLVETLLG